jgi:hypothetical protein
MSSSNKEQYQAQFAQAASKHAEWEKMAMEKYEQHKAEELRKKVSLFFQSFRFFSAFAFLFHSFLVSFRSLPLKNVEALLSKRVVKESPPRMRRNQFSHQKRMRTPRSFFFYQFDNLFSLAATCTINCIPRIEGERRSSKIFTQQKAKLCRTGKEKNEQKGGYEQRGL